MKASVTSLADTQSPTHAPGRTGQSSPEPELGSVLTPSSSGSSLGQAGPLQGVASCDSLDTAWEAGRSVPRVHPRRWGALTGPSSPPAQVLPWHGL